MNEDGARSGARKPAPMRGKWVLISVLVIGVGIAGAALSLRYRHPAASAPPAGAAVVTKPDLLLSGTIRPQHVIGVGSPVSGNVETFMADIGDEVFQGQVLARIGSASLESEREAAAHALEAAQEQVSKAESAINAAKLEESRAAADAQRSRMALERAEKTYSRQKTLHSSGATPRLTFEKAEEDYQAAIQEFDIMDKAARGAAENVRHAVQELASAKQAMEQKSRQLEDAQHAFEKAEVRAPIDGLIVGRKGEVGKPAEEAGDQLFQIAADVFALEVPVDVKPDALKRLHPGQAATVTVLDLQTGGIPATVKEIKESQAIIEFSSTIPAIRPGMRADVRLKLE